MIKPGDKVRVIRNEVHACHPSLRARLKEGETVIVWMLKNGSVIYKLNSGSTNGIPIEDVELVEEFVDKCTCESIFMTNNGCKCGFLQREKELI